MKKLKYNLYGQIKYNIIIDKQLITCHYILINKFLRK